MNQVEIGFTWTDFVVVETVTINNPPEYYPLYIETIAEVVSNDSGTFILDTVVYDQYPLDLVKTDLKYQLNDFIENNRGIHSTFYPNQIMTNHMKYGEALEVAANSNANVVDYPLTASMIGLPGITTLQEAANTIITTQKEWITYTANLEHSKVYGEYIIDEATTVNAAVMIFENWYTNFPELPEGKLPPLRKMGRTKETRYMQNPQYKIK
jgi:hypothetical protein